MDEDYDEEEVEDVRIFYTYSLCGTVIYPLYIFLSFLSLIEILCKITVYYHCMEKVCLSIMECIFICGSHSKESHMVKVRGGKIVVFLQAISLNIPESVPVKHF